ncbi:MAG: GMC family oxidoreductase [Marinobacter sp.]
MTKQFDVIVIGAGSAGCAVAYRLAKESSLQVLLLEAGSADKSMMIHMPMGFAFLLKPHKNNWAYRTLPEPHLNHREVDLPRGKVLGGCSSINGMVYIRGQKEDFDRWSALGNKGWSYEDVLPYFIRSEHNECGADHYHGSGGPLWISSMVDEFPIHQAFIEASLQAGYGFNADVNGEAQDGVSWFPRTIKNGKRHSSARAFLGAGKHLANLTVVTHANVRRVLVDDSKAVGVEVNVKGEMVIFTANKDVVLSGGAINSPKLLELSGIGQKERLMSLGIPVKKDLPGVGENLQDHWNSYIKQRVNGVKTYYGEAKGFAMIKSLLRYVFTKKGFLANSAATLAVFYKGTDVQETPDCQIHFAPAASEMDAKGNMVPIDAVTIASCSIRPASRGYVHIRSRDLDEAPDIRLNYLATDDDKTLAVAAFRKARNILAQDALKDCVSSEFEPGAQVQSDSDILEYIKNTGEPVHHLAGSCKMGNDAMAVVNSRLQVHGVENLRVADASIMPDLVSGNTHAACVMIGEKCADFILGECIAPSA